MKHVRGLEKRGRRLPHYRTFCEAARQNGHPSVFSLFRGFKCRERKADAKAPHAISGLLLHGNGSPARLGWAEGFPARWASAKKGHFALEVVL
jgi:hypothetical protein